MAPPRTDARYDAAGSRPSRTRRGATSGCLTHMCHHVHAATSGGSGDGGWSGGEREANLAVMSEMTQEEALRLADALVGQALKETEARCAVLGQFINDCEHKGSRTSAWSEALRELRALHGCRTGLMRRHSLIQEALDCPVGECPAKVPLPLPRDRTVLRLQQQVQVQARRRSSSWG
jgi:hypothetical protein